MAIKPAQNEVEMVLSSPIRALMRSIGEGMISMGDALSETIRNRTRAGRDVNNSLFFGYSKEYAARKRSQSVNLVGNARVSRRPRRMIDAFSVSDSSANTLRANTAGRGSTFIDQRGRFAKIGRDMSLVLDFDDIASAELAAIHHFGGGRMPIRAWVGFTPTEAQEAFAVLGRRLNLGPNTTTNVNINLVF